MSQADKFIFFIQYVIHHIYDCCWLATEATRREGEIYTPDFYTAYNLQKGDCVEFFMRKSSCL